MYQHQHQRSTVMMMSASNESCCVARALRSVIARLKMARARRMSAYLAKRIKSGSYRKGENITSALINSATS